MLRRINNKDGWGMMKRIPRIFGGLALGISFTIAGGPTMVHALPSQQESMPEFEAIDIKGETWTLQRILEKNPRLTIFYFFNVESGKQLAQRISYLRPLYPRDKLSICAFGVKEDEAALKKFADDYEIDYAVIPENEKFIVEKTFGTIDVVPITIIAAPNVTILKILKGGGKLQDKALQSHIDKLLLTTVAEVSTTQGDFETASKVADAAMTAGEDKAAAAEIKGYALVGEGKYDEAEKEFAAADSKAGLATVALEQGDTKKAQEIAAQAAPDDGDAKAVAGRAMLQEGKFDEAAAALKAAESSESAYDFQKANAVAGQGRIAQEKGETDAAIEQYRAAQSLDPFNVQALSNEGAALREKGDLKGSEEVLKKTTELRADADPLVGMMLVQVQRELKNANDLKRRELINKQIEDLSARAKALKASGQLVPVDPWTTRPMIVAFLPTENAAPVFFERAGTELAIRREIETKLQGKDNIQVVEREVLDQLLQELNLGSSELADPNTQLQLGKVLAAPVLGFIDFAQTGPQITMHLRTVEVETTKILTQLTKNLAGPKEVTPLVDGVVDELATALSGKRLLQGLIASADADDNIVINLGTPLGVAVGQKYQVLQDTEPVVVGGKTIPGRPKKVATIEVTEVDEQLSVCKLVEKADGVTLAKEMKIKEIEAK